MKDIVEKNSTFAFVSNLGVILFIFRRPFLKMAASGQENENFGWPNILRKIPIYVCSKFGAFLIV